ncbi:MAG: DNA-3-methyladenine glycosylase [Bdellovibrionales bacterium]|nr:DNA-3-methyladenine glycosylase [Oligoflexia bacterium]
MDASFFERDTVVVARELVGKILIVRDSKTKKKYKTRIVETEAYRGEDPASHSARGWTKRCAPMFEEPARTYVYFIYGMYQMLNFVTEPDGIAGAVLIRALDPLTGFGAEKTHKLLNGPGKLCRELGIVADDNRKPLMKGRFQVQDDGVVPELIRVTPRVGIREEKPFRPWRFIWAGHPAVSKVKENAVILDEIFLGETLSIKKADFP